MATKPTPTDNTAKPRMTPLAVANLKPRAQRYIEWYQGPGLGVRVFPSGAKSFVYWYRYGSRKRLVTLGTYPGMTVAAAQAAHKEALKQTTVGIDVAAAAQQTKEQNKRAAAQAELEAAGRPTLRSVVTELRSNAAFLSRKSATEILRQIDKDIVPALGDRPFEELRKRDAVLVIDKVRERGAKKGRSANGGRIANACAANFVRLGKFAVKRGLLEDDRNPFRDFERTRLAAKDRALGVPEDDQDDDRTWELQRTLQRLPHVGMHPVTVLALLFVLATGQRPGEVAEMPKAELKKDGALWTIAAARYKTRWQEANPKPHHVPLSAFAQRLLAIAARYNASSPWVFPSPQDPKRHLDRNSLSRAVDRKQGTATLPSDEPAANTLGVTAFTPHDLRRTCRTWLARLGVQDAVAEKVLGHKLSGVLGIYNRHSYLDERRAALELWGSKLQELAPGLLDVLAAPPPRKRTTKAPKPAAPRKMRGPARRSAARQTS